ncbi:MAG: sugar ABC transporter permease [Bacilli bacterium]
MKKKRKKKFNRYEELVGTLFAAIPVIGIIVFAVIPLLLSLIMSFANLPSFDIKSMTMLDFGNLFNNYKTVFNDPLFAQSVKNTLYAAVSLPLSIIIGLILAVLLNQKLRGKKFYRTVFFIPYVCSIVAVTLMWRTLLNRNYGAINELLGIFGIGPVAWLTDDRFYMPAMIIMGVWCGVGFNLILFSASLTNISPTIYEAAELDGAGPVRKFFSITLPLLSPTTFYLFVVGMIASLQEFVRFQAMNAVNSNLISPTGPNNAGLTIVFYLYNLVFAQSGGLGLAAATSWILAIITVILTAISFKITRKAIHYE